MSGQQQRGIGFGQQGQGGQRLAAVRRRRSGNNLRAPGPGIGIERDQGITADQRPAVRVVQGHMAGRVPGRVEDPGRAGQGGAGFPRQAVHVGDAPDVQRAGQGHGTEHRNRPGMAHGVGEAVVLVQVPVGMRGNIPVSIVDQNGCAVLLPEPGRRAHMVEVRVGQHQGANVARSVPQFIQGAGEVRPHPGQAGVDHGHSVVILDQIHVDVGVLDPVDSVGNAAGKHYEVLLRWKRKANRPHPKHALHSSACVVRRISAAGP